MYGRFFGDGQAGALHRALALLGLIALAALLALLVPAPRARAESPSGFVTGSGRFDLPAGAYLPDLSLSGKATFGSVSKYRKGASVPEGNAGFQFQAGGFTFHSTACDWLVVAGKSKTQFKGSGRVNGGLDPDNNEYKFMLWAGDRSPDTFRIRIWWEDVDGVEYDVYDNGFNQEIGGGSIVVHTK